MCSGDLCNLPAAPESKDLIAIIHPIHWQQTQSLPRLPVAGKLHLSNRFADVTTSQFQLQYHYHNHNHGVHAPPGPVPDSTASSVSVSSSRSLSRSPSPDPNPSPTETATLTLTIRIHKFGQPLALTGEFENPVVHSFAMATETFVGMSQTRLGKRLDLGVGGEGVVGRTVSVVGVDGGVLGEGVIGIGRI